MLHSAWVGHRHATHHRRGRRRQALRDLMPPSTGRARAAPLRTGTWANLCFARVGNYRTGRPSAFSITLISIGRARVVLGSGAGLRWRFLNAGWSGRTGLPTGPWPAEHKCGRSLLAEHKCGRSRLGVEFIVASQTGDCIDDRLELAAASAPHWRAGRLEDERGSQFPANIQTSCLVLPTGRNHSTPPGSLPGNHKGMNRSWRMPMPGRVEFEHTQFLLRVPPSRCT
jgi:hypothetical protein